MYKNIVMLWKKKCGTGGEHFSKASNKVQNTCMEMALLSIKITGLTICKSKKNGGTETVKMNMVSVAENMKNNRFCYLQ